MKNTCKISPKDIYEQFPTEDDARKYIEQKRWGASPVCPHCGRARTQIATKRRGKAGYYKCCGCKKVYTVRTGTIFEHSHVEFRTWMLALYYIAVNRKGISSYALSKLISTTQNTAWFILQRIRKDCEFDIKRDGLLSGIVEINETYVGGKEMNKHEYKKLKKGRGAIGKTAVLGMREKESGKVYAFVLPNANASSIQRFIKKWVTPGSVIHTDESHVYNGLESSYTLERVNHSQKEFSRNGVTTNRIEGFWGCVKRSLLGTWHEVEPKHLQGYVNECCYRLNDGRVQHNMELRMDSVVDFLLGGKHFSYKEMTSKLYSYMLAA